MRVPVLTALVSTAAAFFLAACAPQKPLEVLGQIASFQLTDQTGRAFDSRSLAGHIWVADFIYTTCPGPCPMMSSDMHKLQDRTASTPDLKLVSFTVDPAHDTPPILAAYARHFVANPARWSFLTGEQAKLNDLGFNSFHLNAVDGSLVHSTRFVLVDRRMRIRGYYSSSDDGFINQLLAGIHQLQGEHS